MHLASLGSRKWQRNMADTSPTACGRQAEGTLLIECCFGDERWGILGTVLQSLLILRLGFFPRVQGSSFWYSHRWTHSYLTCSIVMSSLSCFIFLYISKPPQKKKEGGGAQKDPIMSVCFPILNFQKHPMQILHGILKRSKVSLAQSCFT